MQPPITDEQLLRIAPLWGNFTEEEKKQVLSLVLASENYHKTHITLVYEPSDKQRIFHVAPNKVRAIFGGNQSGKTYAGGMEDAFHFTGEYPDWYPVEQRLEQPNVGRILVKDFPKGVGEVIEPALARSIHPRFIKSFKRNSQGYLVKLIGINGSRIDIVTHDMDTQSLEGWQGDWLHADEPAPRDKWVACMRGLIRRAGRAWLTCTPLTEPWIYDEIYTKPNVCVVNIDMRDNQYLTESEVKEFESNLNQDEIEARIHGKFMFLTGRVYKDFDKIHIKPAGTEIPLEWPRWRVVDPHDRKPFACAWFAVDPRDRIWWYREWPQQEFHKMRQSSMSPKDYVHMWRDVEMNETIYRKIMDVRFGRQPQLTMKGQTSGDQDTLFDVFDDLGEVFEPSYVTTTLSNADPGHQKVNECLRISPATGEPSMFVLENCTNLIYAFYHSVWENHKDPNAPAKEKQSQYAKDFLDLVRYGVMDNPRHIILEPVKTTRSSWANSQPSGTYGSEVIT